MDQCDVSGIFWQRCQTFLCFFIYYDYFCFLHRCFNRNENYKQTDELTQKKTYNSNYYNEAATFWPENHPICI